jgi:hypothetical protein
MRPAPARSISEVVERLDDIVAWAASRQSRLGYFPALYKKVTLAVMRGIEAGEFDDGPRMEWLDVVFANRYLEALAAWRSGQRCTEAWVLAFGLADREDSLILQHLLLGMNAHINLDLGISAAHTAPGEAIEGLQGDFFRINLVLASLVDQVQEELGAASPALRLLDRAAGRWDERLAAGGLRLFRNRSWRMALRLAGQEGEAQQAEIRRQDARVARFGTRIAAPGPLVSAAARLARLGERRPPGEVIALLDGLPRPQVSLLLPPDWKAQMAE